MDFQDMFKSLSTWGDGTAGKSASPPAPASESGPSAPLVGQLAPEAARSSHWFWPFGDSDDKKKEDPELVHPAKKASELMQKHMEEAKRKIAAQKAADAAKEKREHEVDAEAQKDPLFKKDPARARELADARKDFEGMVDVVDGKQAGAKDRKQNQLSKDEYDKLIKQYADIKAGRTDIKIDTSGAYSKSDEPELREKALRDMRRVMQTSSGRGLMTALADNKDKKGVHHTTTIHSTKDSVAETESKGDASGGPQNATVNLPAGQILQGPGADPSVPWANLLRSDVALYHELVHAYHVTKGDVAPGTLPGVDPLDKNISAAEYQAVGLGEYGKGGKYAKKGWNTVNGKPFGASEEFNENRYREERNGITDGGKYNDVELPEQLKTKYPDWQKWWADGSMAPRPTYRAKEWK